MLCKFSKMFFKSIFNFQRVTLPFIMLLLISSRTLAGESTHRYYYQLKIYHLGSLTQQARMDQYLERALVPALHRAGIRQVGVFKPLETSTSDNLLYVLVPYPSFEQIEVTAAKLALDRGYQQDGKDVINAEYDNIPYLRVETILLAAFPRMPAPFVPQLKAPKSQRVYELRSYESPTEKYNKSKVDMFNVGNEVAIFKRLGFNAIFYAKVLAGSHMPNLMYLTTFNNKADREAHWKLFNEDPDWKRLLNKPAYQHNVSKAEIWLLHPTTYSDF